MPAHDMAMKNHQEYLDARSGTPRQFMLEERIAQIATFIVLSILCIAMGSTYALITLLPRTHAVAWMANIEPFVFLLVAASLLGIVSFLMVYAVDLRQRHLIDYGKLRDTHLKSTVLWASEFSIYRLTIRNFLCALPVLVISFALMSDMGGGWDAVLIILSLVGAVYGLFQARYLYVNDEDADDIYRHTVPAEM